MEVTQSNRKGISRVDTDQGERILEGVTGPWALKLGRPAPQKRWYKARSRTSAPLKPVSTRTKPPSTSRSSPGTGSRRKTRPAGSDINAASRLGEESAPTQT